jgi:hypothetical protein
MNDSQITEWQKDFWFGSLKRIIELEARQISEVYMITLVFLLLLSSAQGYQTHITLFQ